MQGREHDRKSLSCLFFFLDVNNRESIALPGSNCLSMKSSWKHGSASSENTWLQNKLHHFTFKKETTVGLVNNLCSKESKDWWGLPLYLGIVRLDMPLLCPPHPPFWLYSNSRPWSCKCELVGPRYSAPCFGQRSQKAGRYGHLGILYHWGIFGWSKVCIVGFVPLPPPAYVTFRVWDKEKRDVAGSTRHSGNPQCHLGP